MKRSSYKTNPCLVDGNASNKTAVVFSESSTNESKYRPRAAFLLEMLMFDCFLSRGTARRIQNKNTE